MPGLKPVYLDYAAATPVDSRVLAAMRPYFAGRFHNSGAAYMAGRDAARDLEMFRSRIAVVLGARPTEIVFMAGATEANNLAIHGCMRRYPGSRMVFSALEHPSVAEPAAQYDSRMAPVTPEGVLDLGATKKLLDDRTVLVSCMYANNEIGTVQPLRRLAALLKDVRRDRRRRGIELPLYLHSDASQAAAYLDLHVSRLGLDMMTVNGGKIYGPKQSSALFVRSGTGLQAQLSGGGQERGLRSGTESLAQCAGLCTALELVQGRRLREAARLKKLQNIFFTLLERDLPVAAINGSRRARLPNNVHITVPGYSSDRLVLELDRLGIQCAAGSACSAAGDKPSHVLAALGLDEPTAGASLRFTMGRATTEGDVRRTVAALAALVSPV